MARRSKFAVAAVAAALVAVMGATSVSAAPVGAGRHHVVSRTDYERCC